MGNHLAGGRSNVPRLRPSLIERHSRPLIRPFAAIEVGAEEMTNIVRACESNSSSVTAFVVENCCGVSILFRFANDGMIPCHAVCGFHYAFSLRVENERHSQSPSTSKNWKVTRDNQMQTNHAHNVSLHEIPGSMGDCHFSQTSYCGIQLLEHPDPRRSPRMNTCVGTPSLIFHTTLLLSSHRYETMLEEEDLFREWYRPHTERLEKLLGRKMMW